MKIARLLFTITLISLICFSCKKSEQKELTNMIPADASYVMYINTQSLAKKSNYDIFQNVTVSRAVNLGKAMLDKKETIELLDGLTKDINSAGLNLKGDCYFYFNNSVVGIVLGVNDAGKIKNLLTSTYMADESDIKEEKGTYTFSMNPQLNIMWDKDKILLLSLFNPYTYTFGTMNDINLAELTGQYFHQSGKESISNNKAFGKFLENKKDVSIFYSYAYIDKMLEIQDMEGMEMPSSLKDQISKLKGLYVSTNCSFEKGEIKVDNRAYYEDAETEKRYKDLMNSVTGNLKGDHLKYIPENPILLVSANLKGEGIYDFLNTLEILPMLEEEFENSPIDIGTLFKNVNGDITLTLTDCLITTVTYEYINYTREVVNPAFAVLIDITDGSELIKMISGEEFNDVIKKIDNNNYYIESGQENIYIGIINNMFYATNDETVYNNIRQPENLKHHYSNLADGNSALILGNLQKLNKLVTNQIDDEVIAGLLIEGINQTGSFVMTTRSDMSGEGVWEFTDKSRNSFETICLFFDKILNNFNDSLRF